MNEITSFEALALAAPIQDALRDKEYHTPSPIQAQAIPLILEGRDVFGLAQTGTGKTAAFSLPILHALQATPKRTVNGRMRTLVLTPTRELAEQVSRSFKEYGRHLDFSCATIYGGVGAQPQIAAMRRGVDVLVATPGRLLDLRSQGHLQFSGVEYLILDEADRMLDMGFIHDIRRIVAELPRQRQTLFFSATASPEIKQLSESMLKEPAEVTITPKVVTAEKIDHRLCYLQTSERMKLLRMLIDEQTAREGSNLTLVFSRTKHGANRIAKQLTQLGVKVEAIHGNKSQSARQRALDHFSRGRTPVLVATDVAARGIDVRDITLVINYDLPDDPEAYVHRIGRTARAGADGVALSFCTIDRMKELHAIEKLIGQQIPVHTEHEYHDEKVQRAYSQPVPKEASKKQGKGGGSGRGRSNRGGGNKRSGRRPSGLAKPEAPKQSEGGVSRRRGRRNRR